MLWLGPGGGLGRRLLTLGDHRLAWLSREISVYIFLASGGLAFRCPRGPISLRRVCKDGVVSLSSLVRVQ